MTPLPQPHYQDPQVSIYAGDCLDLMRDMEAGTINTCVTSPPYWGLRDYGMPGQLGLEKTPEEYVARMVEIFREVRRLLRDDGTLFLNLGDSYASNGKDRSEAQATAKCTMHGGIATQSGILKQQNKLTAGLKLKDLVDIPWMVAFALRADGWYLRQDIIWAKPNPMPESVTDRCTKSHEYLFLLSKSSRYYFDAEAIKEPVGTSSLRRYDQNIEAQQGSGRVPGKTNGAMKAVGGPLHKGNRKTFRGGGAYTGSRSFNNSSDAVNDSAGNTSTRKVDTDTMELLASPRGRSQRQNFRRDNAKHGTQKPPNSTHPQFRADRADSNYDIYTRNKRSVWTVATQGFKDAHFATFPPDLIKPCILAGCPAGGTVLDPFMGAGTTAYVAKELGRKAIGCELNPAYIDLAEKRTRQEILL